MAPVARVQIINMCGKTCWWSCLIVETLDIVQIQEACLSCGGGGVGVACYVPTACRKGSE